jgi:hypothetical protein
MRDNTNRPPFTGGHPLPLFGSALGHRFDDRVVDRLVLRGELFRAYSRSLRHESSCLIQNVERYRSGTPHPLSG